LEKGDEAFDFLAPFREIHGTLSYGVFFAVSPPIHGKQSLQ
jgi:hypothetical protein